MNNQRLATAFAVFVSSVALGTSSLEAQGQKKVPKPDRLVRFLPVGNPPPFIQKIIKGVRVQQPPPAGAVPPLNVVQMNPKGQPEGNAVQLKLEKVSASIPARVGAFALHEDGPNGPEQKAWHKVKIPKSTHSLALLWRDPVEKKWTKARSMMLVDDIKSFPAGTMRLVNVSPWSAIIVWKGRRHTLPAGKTARIPAGKMDQVALKVSVRAESGREVVIYDAALNQGATERTNVVVYQADGVKPRRPAKVLLFRELAKLPAPPRPQGG